MDRDRLAEFYESIRRAQYDPNEVEGIKSMIAHYAMSDNVPLNAILAMATALADYRKQEIKNEAERN